MTNLAPVPQLAQIDTRDRRVDALGTWALTAAAGVMLAAAAWQFQALTAEVKGMRQDLAAITTRVAVVEMAREQIHDLDSRVRALESRKP